MFTNRKDQVRWKVAKSPSFLRLSTNDVSHQFLLKLAEIECNILANMLMTCVIENSALVANCLISNLLTLSLMASIVCRAFDKVLVVLCEMSLGEDLDDDGQVCGCQVSKGSSSV